jgi:hypothetical protein
MVPLKEKLRAKKALFGLMAVVPVFEVNLPKITVIYG